MIGEVKIVSGQRSAAARVAVNLRSDCSVHHIFIEIIGKDAKNAENIFSSKLSLESSHFSSNRTTFSRRCHLICKGGGKRTRMTLLLLSSKK